MDLPRNVVPFQPNADPQESRAPVLLGKLAKDDFELWVSRSPDGVLALKWWRWREDDERFDPLEDGRLSLEPAELRPLADLLTSVANRLEGKF